MKRPPKRSKKAAEAPARRVPLQARSQRRFESILLAAAELFAANGFDATTMEAIAARAESSIGSVYQFFPNKRAVFRELAQRCMAASSELFADLLKKDIVKLPWREVVDLFIDGFRELNRRPEITAVWGNLQLYGEFAEEDMALQRQFIDASAAMFTVWAPDMDEARRHAVATLVVNAIAISLGAMTQAKEPRASLLLEETKRLICRYLAPYFDG